jgi:hypothetical protein
MAMSSSWRGDILESQHLKRMCLLNNHPDDHISIHGVLFFSIGTIVVKHISSEKK